MTNNVIGSIYEMTGFLSGHHTCTSKYFMLSGGMLTCSVSFGVWEVHRPPCHPWLFYTSVFLTSSIVSQIELYYVGYELQIDLCSAIFIGVCSTTLRLDQLYHLQI